MRNIKKILSVTLIVLIVGSIIRFWLIKPKEVRADSLFRLDEGYGTTTNESNGSVGAGTITGATWKTDDLCRRDKCLFFDGSGDNVAFSDDVDLDFTATNTFTITGWFRHPTIATNPDYLVTKHQASTAGGYKIYMDSDGDLAFAIDDDGTWGPEDVVGDDQSKNYDDNRWHFFAAVKDGTTGIYLYVDGVLIDQDTSLTASGSLVNAASFYIGIDADGTSNAWEGFIDEVKVVRQAKTAVQIATDYLGGTTTFTGNAPIGWWRMDESAANICTGGVNDSCDSSGNVNDGAWNGNATSATGKFGNAISLDGTGDYVQVTGLMGSPTSITLAGWVNLTSPDTNGAELVTLGDIVSIRLDTSSQLQAFFYDGTDWRVTTINDTLAAEGWHHLAYTVDTVSKVQKLYLDGGVTVGSSSFTGSINYSGQGTNTLIGSHGNGSTNYDFNGLIDDVRIYNYARSATQILEDMVANPPSGVSASFGPDQGYLSDGLVGYWKMEEAGDATRADSSGNGNTLTESASDTIAQAVGKYGYAGDFEADDTETLSITDASQKGLDLVQTFTFSFWLNLESTDQERGILQKGGCWNNSYCVTVDWQRIKIILDDDGNGGNGNTTLQADNIFSTTGVWNLYTITYDGQSVRLFKDGKEQITGSFPSTTTTALYNSSSDFIMGSGTAYFDGIIDETRIYNRALSPAEVAKLYAWAPGPDAYWKMEEESNSSRDDSSGNGSTLSESASDDIDKAIGKFGSAADFELDNVEYLEVADNQYVSAGNIDMTITAWVKLESISGGDQYVVWKGGIANSTREYHIRTDGTDDWRFGWNPGGGAASTEISFPMTIQTNTWYFLVAYHKASNGEVGFSVNNSTFVTGTVSGGNDSTSSFRIGGDQNGSTNLDGLVDEVKIYKYIRTGAQILEDMNGGHPAPGSPVGSATGYWKFDEGFSTTAYDSNKDTGGAEDLTLSTASWTNSAKFGKAWNGTGALWVFLADDNDLDFAVADDFTLSLWFKSDSATNPGATEWILNKSLSGGTQEAGYAVYANTSGQLCFGIDDDTTWTPDVESCTTADYYDATWHHIVAVRNVTSDTTKIYIDAVEKDSDTDTTTATLANGRILYLGDRQGADAGDELNGDIDEVKIYRSALTADQVKVEYNHGFGQSMGALSTDSTGVATNSDLDAYCPPGQGSSCTAPVGHWKFDENTGTTSTFDTSANGNTGTLTGSMTADDWVPGKIGSALDFDGSNDAVTVTDNATLDFTSDFSIEFWINPDTSSQSERLVTKMASANSDGYDIMLWNGELNPMVNSTFDWTISGAAPTAGQWTHVAWTKSGTTSIVYMNGLVKGTNTGTPATVNTNAAALAIGGAFTDWFINGKLDDVRVYNYARTPAQVAWDMNRGAPVGHWRMDETSWNGTASEVKDSSGNANHGVRAGNATTTSSGKFNYAGTFDNLGDYVSITNATPLEITGDLTISAWVKRNSSSAQDTIADMALDGETEATNHLYHLYFDSSGFLNLIWEYGAGSNQTTQSSVAVSTPTGTWSHIAVTRNVTTNEVKYYENGIQLGTTQSFTNDPTGGTTANLILGAAGSTLGDWPFDGLIDDVRLYNYVATPQQIRTIMNEGAATRF